MKPSDVKPITYMKNRAAELISTVSRTRKAVVITQNGEPRAVVMDVKSYEKMQDALLLWKLLSQSEEDFRKGRALSQREVEAALAKRLRA